jgi:hypothetical protein
MADNFADPYEGNVLTSGLGTIMSIPEILRRTPIFLCLPCSMGDIPRHVRLHLLMRMRDLHIPPLEERRVHQTVAS